MYQGVKNSDCGGVHTTLQTHYTLTPRVFLAVLLYIFHISEEGGAYLRSSSKPWYACEALPDLPCHPGHLPSCQEQ